MAVMESSCVFNVPEAEKIMKFHVKNITKKCVAHTHTPSFFRASLAIFFMFTGPTATLAVPGTPQPPREPAVVSTANSTGIDGVARGTHPAAARPHVPDGYTLFSHSGNTLVLSRPTGPKAASPVLCPPNACLPALKVSGDGAIAVNPALARTRRGNGLCAWQQLTSGTLAAGTYALYCASYDTFNNRWRAPKNLSEGAPVSGSDALEPQVAVDKCGHGMTVWKQANGYDETSSTTVYNIVGRPYTLNWKRGEKLLEPANISLDQSANADLPNLKISACCQGLVAWQETVGTATVIWVSGKTSSFAQQHVESTETLSAGDATNQVSALRSSGGGSISLSSAPGTVFIYVVGDIDGDLDINLEAPSAFAVAAPTKSIGDPSIPSITLTVNEGKKISGHCAINIKPGSTVGDCSLNIDKAAVIEDYCTVTVGENRRSLLTRHKRNS